jgi:general stress protein 26
MTTFRSFETRRDDAIRKLEQDADVWIATGGADGKPHLVPLSLSWDGEKVVLATEARSPTTANLRASRQARLALGNPRDVVVIDADGEVVPVQDQAAEEAVLRYKARTGWDPRSEDGEWVMLFLRPLRIQVWNNVAEIKGRTIMRDGHWVA